MSMICWMYSWFAWEDVWEQGWWKYQINTVTGRRRAVAGEWFGCGIMLRKDEHWLETGEMPLTTAQVLERMGGNIFQHISQTTDNTG